MTLPSGVTRVAAGAIGLVAASIAFSCANGQPEAQIDGMDTSGGASSAGAGAVAGQQSVGGSQQSGGSFGASGASGTQSFGGSSGIGSAGNGSAGVGTAGASGSGSAGVGTSGTGSSTAGTGSSTAGASGAGTSGTTGSGGSSGTCTDLPPNNGDTCAHAVQYGWCGMSWLAGSCERSCGVCTGGGTAGTSSSGGSSGSGSAGTGSAGTGSAGTGSGGACSNPPPQISGGSNGWASRYWDCCKPACGWKGNVKTGNAMASCSQSNQSLGATEAGNACTGGGSAFMCWSDVPWSVCDKLSYGFAAASGNNYTCGRCFQLQFNGGGHSGTNAGATSLNGKTMIVQVINNGGVQADQFDILIPGGGVGALNACSTQWGASTDLGTQYGGLGAECMNDKNCIKQKCQAAFGDKPDLLAGCNWYLDWFNAADNPTFTFKQVACPAALTQKSGLSDPG